MREANHSHFNGNLQSLSMKEFFFNKLNISNSPNAFKLVIKLTTC